MSLIEDIVRFMASPWFQLPFQFAMYYLYFKIGQRGARIKAARAFMVQDLYVQQLEVKLNVATTHIENLQAQLEEANAR